ncbi:MAG: alcohol dehydrogenase catalytic domain-containing protein [Anaerolineae bacterium]|nr:alcohol dehydrogenase catalytic domain-containing protein [Anaerolineae bacterium]
MKALVKAEPGPGLAMQEVAQPQVGSHDVLVKVRACSICGTDLHLYQWDRAGSDRLRPPMIIGHEFCGYAVRCGPGVTSIREGDFVSADSHLPDWSCSVCRNGLPHLCANLHILGVDRPGAFAEYVSLPETSLWVNDPGLDPALASIQDPMGNAVHATLVEPVAGRSVVIFGDGPTGLGAVAVARAAGAAVIVHVGLSDFLLDIGRRLGATESIHAKRQDPVAEVRRLCGGEGADVVLEMSGSPAAVRQGLECLRPGGRFSAFGLTNGPVELDLTNQVIFKGARILGITGRVMWETWYQMAGLLRSGRLDFGPIVTHRLPFEQWQHAFDLLLAPDRRAAKIVLFMDEDDQAIGRRGTRATDLRTG